MYGEGGKMSGVAPVRRTARGPGVRVPDRWEDAFRGWEHGAAPELDPVSQTAGLEPFSRK